MAERGQIENFEIYYTDEAGWIDSTHAKGGDALKLKFQIENENLSHDFFKQYPQFMSTPLFKTYFIIDYTQSMYKYGYRAGKNAQWLVKRGLGFEEKKSIALAIMLNMTMHFETLQGNWFYHGILRSDSSFSGEDVISNLLGFYKIFEPKNYDIYLGVASREKAFRIWDHYGAIGNFKNRELRPWIFPDPLIYPNSKPYKKELPFFLRTIQPFDLNNNGEKVLPFSPTKYIHSYNLNRFIPFN
uniref:Uncharacterized protein n=1 Tax=Providencia stuartii TaxID=588 RepID=A0AAI9DCP0_PROST|nr:hypothetical protein [Providencia stuartii]